MIDPWPAHYYVCTVGHITRCSFHEPRWCTIREPFVESSEGAYCNTALRKATDVEEAALRLGGVEAFAQVWKP